MSDTGLPEVIVTWDESGQAYEAAAPDLTRMVIRGSSLIEVTSKMTDAVQELVKIRTRFLMA